MRFVDRSAVDAPSTRPAPCPARRRPACASPLRRAVRPDHPPPAAAARAHCTVPVATSARIGRELAYHVPLSALGRAHPSSQFRVSTARACLPHLSDEVHRGALASTLRPMRSCLDAACLRRSVDDAHRAELRRAGLLDVAHAAVDLDAERGELDARLGAPALHDRRSAARRWPAHPRRIGMTIAEVHAPRRRSASARIASVCDFIVISMRRTSG